MKHAFRSFLLAAASLVGLASIAQPTPPYPIIITGMVQGCMPNSQVTIASMPGTQPSWSYTLDLVNCGFDTVAWMQSPGGAFTFNVACNGAMLTAVGQYQVDPSGSDSILVVLNCGGGGTPDCLGVPGGSALPGTACTTALGLAGVWGTNCTCELNAVVDCEGVPNGPAMPGMPCTNPATGVSGLWSPDCICVSDTTGGAYDCLGVLNGNNLPGTPCWMPGTNFIGTWDANCDCTSGGGLPCQAGFWVIQAYGQDSLPVPNEVWVWNLSSSANTTFSLSGSTTAGSNILIIEPGCATPQIGATVGGTGVPLGTSVTAVATPTIVILSNMCTTTATGIYTFTLAEQTFAFVWDFGDGTTSTEAYPTHVYATGGPYQLCLTMTDGACCTSTYCDDVSVDEDGLYTGLIVDGRPGLLRSGFTISVRSEQPTAITERELVENVALWPNPVEDVIGLSFNSLNNASLSLTIFDLNGRVVRSTNTVVNTGQNDQRINVADLEAGMYLLQITNGAQRTSRRFVKR